MGNDSTPSPGKQVLEILYDGYYYDVTEWVKRHPGGKIIEFFTEPGEDATIGIKQFHHRSEKRVQAIMASLKKRPAQQVVVGSGALGAKHKAMTEDYLTLFKELLDEGYFKPSVTHVALRFLEIGLVLALTLYLTLWSGNPYLRFLAVLLHSVNSVRCAYIVHESGHRSLTGNVRLDKLVELFTDGFMIGLSSSYWNSQHNRHHAFPQRLDHDVDLETLPLIAFSKKVVRTEKDANSFFIRNQALLFLTLDTFLVSVAWKYYLHPKYALHKGKYAELVLMALNNLVFFKIFGAWSFVFGVWLTSTILLGNFALNHSHLGVGSSSEPLHWAQYAFEHTVDITHSNLVDWWMGSLNYQVEHHLFPQIPHFRLWRITGKVKAYADKHGLPFKNLGYWEAVKINFGNLHQVSQDVSKEFSAKTE